MTRPVPLSSPGSVRPFPGSRLARLCWCWCLVAGLVSSAWAEGLSPVRFAFSRRLFGHVNQADARAAVVVYARTIAGERGIPMDPEPQFLDGPTRIARAIEQGAFELISMPVDEYFTVGAQGLADPFIISVHGGSTTEEYVLVTRTENGVSGLDQLQGSRLVVSGDSRDRLGMVWLEVLLARRGLGLPEKVFQRITTAGKPATVVLPVYFNQADVCLVSGSGFAVMGELNPQVKQHLRVLARSEPLVPDVTAFRRGVPQPTIDAVLEATRGMLRSRTAKQVLTLFKAESLEILPASCLDSARRLLEEHARSVGTRPGGATAEGAREP